MAYDGRAVANFVLDHADQLGIKVTNLSLQKLVYFCHLWSLIELGRPLVKQSFEAWEYGPVLQYLYREFKRFGGAPITDRAQQTNPFNGRKDVVRHTLDPVTEELLKRVVGFYGRLSAGALVSLTHAHGGPWHRVWHQSGRINPGMHIDDREILRFYSHIPQPFRLQ